MTLVFINPGSGPVSGTTRRNADANMRALLRDAGLTGRVTWGRRGPIEGGRYDYRVALRGSKKSTIVSMPGLPLDRVRYMNAPDQNAWNFPRLYVDGSSWLWEFAITNLLDALGLASEADRIRDERDAVDTAKRSGAMP